MFEKFKKRAKNPPTPRDSVYRLIHDLQRKTQASAMISVGPPLNIKSANDARKKGIKGAQWCAVDDSCPLCKYLDGMVISIDHPDFERVVPPLHNGCKCIRVYIDSEATGTVFDWVTPPQELWDKHFEKGE